VKANGWWTVEVDTGGLSWVPVAYCESEAHRANFGIIGDTMSDDMDYLFVRLTPDQFARALFTKDVRVAPTKAQLAEAKSILDRTGYLYRLVAGFDLDEWQHKPHPYDR
jgi:hypothetical protein